MLGLRRINFPVLLLSFALAVLLWMHVKNVVGAAGPTLGPSSFSVDLELRNQPSGTVIVGEVPSNVTFTAIGSLEEQRKINISYLKAFVDLAEKPADGRYRVRLETTADYQVEWRPADLRIPITLESEVTQRVMVDVEEIGTLRLQDYRFIGSTSEPREITIRGAKSQVAKVKRARAYLNLGALDEENSQKAKVELVDEKESPISNVSLSTDVVTLRALIEPRAPRRSLAIQPVWSGKQAFDIKITEFEFSPREVIVEGPADLLANLRVIYTKPINVEGITQTTTIPVELELPADVRLTKKEAITIKVFVVKSGEPPNNSGGQ